MEEQDDIIPTDENIEASEYYKFHVANLGCCWLEEKTGKKIGKGILFLKFGRFPVILQKLTKGTFEGYVKMKK